MPSEPIDISALSAEQKRALLAQLLQEQAAASVSSHPLSYGQRALWFLYQLVSDNAAYNLTYAARVLSDIDISALQRAVQALVDRHPVLRTTYATRGGEPMQQIHVHQKADFEVVEAAEWTDEHLNEWRQQEADRPFNLEQGPVLRVKLLRRAAGQHILSLTAHHIAVDFWSLDVILDDLQVFYAAVKGKRPLPAPPPDQRQYTDYVQWQAAMLDSKAGQQHWEYWRAQLGRDVPVVNLPTDCPRPPVQTYRGTLHHFRLNAELAGRLRELAKNAGVTLYVTLLAAYQVLIYRYSAQEDVLVGSPMAGRNLPGLEETVGHFVNPVIVRSDLSDDPAFSSLLRRVHETVLGAISHQDFPFSLLVERLQPPRDLSRSPLFQIAFAWDRTRRFTGERGDGEMGRLAGDELRLQTLAVWQGGSQFDLMLIVREQQGELPAAFQYNTELFDAATIARMEQHFQVLLQAIVEDPAQSISALPLLTSAESELLRQWNSTQRDYPQDQRLHDLFESQVARTPDAVAVSFADRHLTYRELNRHANQLAHRLQSSGIGPDTLVAVCMERSLELIIALLGILKAGGAFVPLDPTHPKERLASILAELQAPVCLTESRLVDRFDNVPTLCLDRDWQVLADLPDHDPVCRAAPDNLAYVIFTSGSTGTPKGAMNTHAGICNRLIWMQETYRLTGADHVLQKTPISFDVSVWELFWPLLAGARLVFAQPGAQNNSAALITAIVENRISTIHFVPSMLQVFLSDPGIGACTSLKRVICSGEALSFDLQERFYDRFDAAELHNLYGPTEAAIDVTFWACERGSRRRVVPIGRPIANTQIYLLDRRMQQTPIGVPGELYIAGVGLARGYLNRPDLTAARFLPNPFADQPGARMYATGDLARFAADGNLEFLGRLDSQVKIRGARVELGEIEQALSQHAAVRAVVATVREDHPGEHRLVVYFVANNGLTPGAGELRSFLMEKLPAYMLPSAFVQLESLPTTPSGKIDRRALPAPTSARPDLEQPFVAPRNQVEATLAKIFAQVLHVDAVGINDDFFALGGASTQSLELAAKAQAEGIPLTPGSVFQRATIAELAAHYAGDEQISDRDQALPGLLPAGSDNTVIESLGVYLPPRSVSTLEVQQGCRTPISFPLERLTGIKSRRVAVGEFSIDLAAKAAADCLAKSAYSPEDIDLLICCNISRCDGPEGRFSFEPSTAIRLRKRFNLENAIAFDISNACAGMFTAIYIADAYLQTGLVRSAMVVSGEYISHLTDTAQKEIEGFLDDRLACLTLGDAGAAIILERASSNGFGFRDIDLYTMSRYASLCIAKATDKAHGGAIMRTDSIRQTAIAVTEAVKHSIDIMKRNSWAPEQVQHLIMHQTSATSLNDAVGAINASFKKPVAHAGNTIYNLSERGNTATTSHFVALHDHILSGKIRSHDNVLFSITGSGQTVGTALYTLDTLPDRIRPVEATNHRVVKAGLPRRQTRAVPIQRGRVRIDSVSAVAPGRQVKASAVELAKVAAAECIKKSSHAATDLEILIHSGVYRDEFMSEPAIAALVAGALNINEYPDSSNQQRTLAFDVMNGGIGFLNACHVTAQLILAKKHKVAMVVASEIENNIGVLPERLRGIRESGCAAILCESGQSREGFGAFVFKYFPAYLDAIASFARSGHGTSYLEVERNEHLNNYYLMCIPAVVEEVLKLEKLNPAEIKVVLPAQISKSFVTELSTRTDIAPDRFINIADDGKDLFTSSLASTFLFVREKGLAHTGDIGLIIEVGAGIQVGCAVYYF